jgi:hypothetical protein
MTHLLELFTGFVIQLFIVVDPVAGIPVFLTITPNKGEGGLSSEAIYEPDQSSGLGKADGCQGQRKLTWVTFVR